MEQFSLFDQYLQGQLSPQEVTRFCSRLMHDEQLRRDFRLYLTLVGGIRREAQQDNIEVNAGLLSLSPEERQTLFGRRRKAKATTAADASASAGESSKSSAVAPDSSAVAAQSSDKASTSSDKASTSSDKPSSSSEKADAAAAPPAKRLSLPKRIMVVFSSVAAMLLLAFGVQHLLFQRSTAFEDSLYSAGLFEGGGNTLFALNVSKAEQSLSQMSKAEIKAKLPEWRKNYDKVPFENEQLKMSRGTHLVLAYSKVGQRKNAKAISRELINHYVKDKKAKQRLKRAIKKL